MRDSYLTQMFQTIFFKNMIKHGDYFELRKVLGSHEDTLVLASLSGYVWIVSTMAGIIFIKDLRVLVPLDGICPSE